MRVLLTVLAVDLFLDVEKSFFCVVLQVICLLDHLLQHVERLVGVLPHVELDGLSVVVDDCEHVCCRAVAHLRNGSCLDRLNDFWSRHADDSSVVGPVFVERVGPHHLSVVDEDVGFRDRNQRLVDDLLDLCTEHPPHDGDGDEHQEHVCSDELDGCHFGPPSLLVLGGRLTTHKRKTPVLHNRGSSFCFCFCYS